MARHHLRFRAVDVDGFEDIRNGRKKVETRAATTNYRDIKTGDTLVITCGKDRFETVVQSAQHFESVREMLKTISLKDIMPKASSIEDAEKAYASYPGYTDKIRQYGIMAFRL